MKRATAAAVLLLAGSLAACAERPTPEDYLSVVPRIVSFVEQDARRNTPGEPASGPLLLDLQSFVANGSRLVEEDLSPAAVGAAVGRPFEAVAHPDSAMLCETPEARDCWVKRYGVYVHLNLIRGVDGRMTALARGTVTDRRTFPTHICDRVWRLVFREEAGGEWTLAEQERRPVPTDC